MFAKTLSISDELMWRYYELLSEKSLEEIRRLKADVASGKVHPKAAKEALATEIVTRYHDEAAAKKAKEAFDRVHKQREIPEELPEFLFEGPVWIAKVLTETKLEPSTSQARRDIKQGAVKINQQKIQDEQLKLEKGEYIVQVGKRKFAKAKVN